ncbi:bile acid:sodium symporter family protein [Noviherbaspirillum autotrophicum]|uniref:Bile acid:sodium symporter n=1 Tax=Noviherbaspirillum autotrophicum TaxID=709839 RepID=A0A0C2BMA4_9BURK|nr:bile acid:sodium symporter family protein [Noviherbaspirillum autotrophicum]KIF81134.1 bile acid:sodium symporter [Noviherbaspirillum autotrophicum]
MARPAYFPDNFTLALAATVALASFFPCSGAIADVFNAITYAAIALLFFLHGAKLSREAVIAGAMHWRLHLVVLASTFVMFPLLGALMKPLALQLITPDLYLGILFLCVLPSTVQSSIALTAMAKGNVPAAVCSASASNLLGIFITPLLVSLIFAGSSASHASLDAVLSIVLQLLLPFVAGQMARKRIGKWVDRHKAGLRLVDQGSILLVVYTAFSAAVNQGLWHQLPPAALAGLVLVNVVLLAVALMLSRFCSRRLGFNRADEIAIVFCGSKKSLATGVPMAKVLFAGHAVGMIVLPLMLFHQIQLMVGSILAQRYARLNG